MLLPFGRSHSRVSAKNQRASQILSEFQPSSPIYEWAMAYMNHFICILTPSSRSTRFKFMMIMNP